MWRRVSIVRSARKTFLPDAGRRSPATIAGMELTGAEPLRTVKAVRKRLTIASQARRPPRTGREGLSSGPSRRKPSGRGDGGSRRGLWRDLRSAHCRAGRVPHRPNKFGAMIPKRREERRRRYGLIKYATQPKALNEAWLIFQVLMVRIHFPPAASQQRTGPPAEASVSEMPPVP